MDTQQPSMKIELKKVEGYEALCPNCLWRTYDKDPKVVVWTMKTHMSLACPNNPDAVKTWSYGSK